MAKNKNKQTSTARRNKLQTVNSSLVTRAVIMIIASSKAEKLLALRASFTISATKRKQH